LTDPLPPKVKRTTLVVRDIDRSRAFYRDVLGFKVWFDREFLFTGKGFPGTKKGDKSHLIICEALDPDIGKIGLLQYTDPKMPDVPVVTDRLGIGAVVFVGEVESVPALARKLEAAGAVVAAPEHIFEVVGADGKAKSMRRICFFDPDGNFFEMSEPPMQ
jgi:catechol 2,3-dioxygenase-like lactoylglutathione lyase family enzyme